MFDFVRGSIFKLAGQFLLDGAVRDFNDCTVSAKVSDITGATPIATLTTAWVDGSVGTLQMTASDTSAWPPGQARIDVVLTDGNGKSIASQPDYFRIVAGPIDG